MRFIVPERDKRQEIINILSHKKEKRVPFMPMCTRTFFFSLPEYKAKFKPVWYGLGHYMLDVPDDQILEDIEYRADFFDKIGATFSQWSTWYGDTAFESRENPNAGIKIKKERSQDNKKFKFIFETPMGNLEQNYEMSSVATIFVHPMLVRT